MYPIIPFWIKCANKPGHYELTLQELPRCSQLLSYRQPAGPSGKRIYGTFVFETIHLSRAVQAHLKANAWDGKVTERDHDFFTWLRSRDRERQVTTILPAAWHGIEILIMEIIESCNFEAWCHQCRELYAPDSVVRVPPQESMGSIFDRRACPMGHLLSEIEIMHVC